ncbi:M protein, serotype 12-like [Cebidichthys violaceus]|uniref:M protein, serotype 12-like n=1 Tax=Cebidichthys violaceus TaxID=271503 RepID=UPI0035CA2607
MKTAQLVSQKPDNQLTSEIAALKQQMAAKELGFEQEKLKIMAALQSEREVRRQALADMKTAQLVSQKPDNQLTSEIAALKQQMAAKELGFEQEKLKIMAALQSEREVRRQALADMKTAQLVSQKPDNQLTSEIAALKQQMAAKELGFEQEKLKIMAALQSEREVRRQALADMKTAQLVSQKPDNQLTSEIAALKQQTAAKELTALEDRMRCELAAEQEHQRQSRVMEERCNQMEEEIKLLTQHNADLQVHNLSLQELAQKTDKEKAQLKKEEKKAKKEVEKTLKKDREEEEKREKKEKKEIAPGRGSQGKPVPGESPD